MTIVKSGRVLCLAILAAASLIAGSTAPGRAGGATPDVPFVDDLVQIQPKILTNLAHIHVWLASQPCRYYRFDESYDSLAAEVNGFLASLADDIKRNNFYEAQWKDESSSIIDELKKFNDLLAQTTAAIEDNSLPPAAPNCPYSAFQSSTSSVPPPQKPALQISVPVSPADWSKMINDAQSRRIEGQINDDQQRAAFAEQIQGDLWPQECQLSLQGKKLPCLKVVPNATPANPNPKPAASPPASP